MSGGYFDYNQYRIEDIIEILEDVVGNYGTNHLEFCEDLSEDTYKTFQRALNRLHLARIYTQRIDWLLSGDDSEETFHERLRDDLERVSKEMDKRNVYTDYEEQYKILDEITRLDQEMGLYDNES